MRCVLLVAVLVALPAPCCAQRRMEWLDRGLVAISNAEGHACVSWRWLGTESDKVVFDVYRRLPNAEPVKLTDKPLADATCFIDPAPPADGECTYAVQAIEEGKPIGAPANTTLRRAVYVTVPLQTLPGHTPNDASVGDLDGDGQYEIVLKQEMRPRDNSHKGETGQTKLEAYTLAGELLWRIDLGPNIREGAHYTQFIVYDLDGDGKAEVACKTADGTIDGQGKVLGDAKANHRNQDGYVLAGPEFLTIFNGQTGEALTTIDYLPARGNVAAWGDNYGNRVDRFNAAIAYLDGEHPSLIMCRGYYTRTVIVAWDWNGRELKPRWTFDTNERGNRKFAGQGNHNISIGDIDADRRDEIVYGGAVIDDDGRGIYSTGLGHGDALHLSDIDPARPGLEIFSIHEHVRHPHGAELRDAKTGEILWSKPSDDVPRGVAMDIDPRHSGYECWALGDGLHGLWNARGERIADRRPRSCNFGIWWDGDLLRELLDRTKITKWDHLSGNESTLLAPRDCASNNGSKSNPCLCADILGDWREEVIWRTADNRALRIYTTTIPSSHRLRTLMHDPQYRLSVAWQNVGYNQPTQPGFYLGDGMKVPPPAEISIAPPAKP